MRHAGTGISAGMNGRVGEPFFDTTCERPILGAHAFGRAIRSNLHTNKGSRNLPACSIHDVTRKWNASALEDDVNAVHIFFGTNDNELPIACQPRFIPGCMGANNVDAL
jgi:hypothetical protein